MTKKMNYENFLYVLTYIISTNTALNASVVTDKKGNTKIMLDGGTKTCRINITINDSTTKYWYDSHYGGIEVAEAQQDSKYKFFWLYTIKPYLCNEFVPILGTEFFISED